MEDAQRGNHRVDDGQLEVELKGLDKVWVAKKQIDVPIANISTIWAGSTEALSTEHSMVKVYGERVSSKQVAGRFQSAAAGVQIWAVHGAGQALVIDLHDFKYDRLVLQVDDPGSVASELNRQVVEAN